MYLKIDVTLIFMIAIIGISVNSSHSNDGIDDLFEEHVSDPDFPRDLELNDETDIGIGTGTGTEVGTGIGTGVKVPEKVAGILSSSEVRAVVVLKGWGHTIGLIHLVQAGNGPVHVSGAIAGLTPLGTHGFHFHERPATGGCESAGEHYNPTNEPHGALNSPRSHVGDLGNVDANIKGIAKINLISHRVSLVGRHSVIGRSLVVHTRTDDLGTGWNRESKKTGNSGGRLACGTVKFVHIKKQ